LISPIATLLEDRHVLEAVDKASKWNPSVPIEEEHDSMNEEIMEHNNSEDAQEHSRDLQHQMRRSLKLPVIPPRQCQWHRTEQPIIDYRNSIIMTLDGYIVAFEEIAAKREVVQAEWERKKEEAEHAKVERARRKAEEVKKRQKQEERQARKEGFSWISNCNALGGRVIKQANWYFIDKLNDLLIVEGLGTVNNVFEAISKAVDKYMPKKPKEALKAV
jgi:hypothetical protein